MRGTVAWLQHYVCFPVTRMLWGKKKSFFFLSFTEALFVIRSATADRESGSSVNDRHSHKSHCSNHQQHSRRQTAAQQQFVQGTPIVDGKASLFWLFDKGMGIKICHWQPYSSLPSLQSSPLFALNCPCACQSCWTKVLLSAIWSECRPISYA